MKTIEEILKEFPGTTKENWSQHKNGSGWVKDTASVDASAYVYGNAYVSG